MCDAFAIASCRGPVLAKKPIGGTAAVGAAVGKSTGGRVDTGTVVVGAVKVVVSNDRCLLSKWMLMGPRPRGGRRRSSSSVSSVSSVGSSEHEKSKVQHARPLISVVTIPFEAKQQIMDEWERESRDFIVFDAVGAVPASAQRIESVANPDLGPPVWL